MWRKAGRCSVSSIRLYTCALCTSWHALCRVFLHPFLKWTYESNNPNMSKPTTLLIIFNLARYQNHHLLCCLYCEPIRAGKLTGLIQFYPDFIPGSSSDHACVEVLYVGTCLVECSWCMKTCVKSGQQKDEQTLSLLSSSLYHGQYTYQYRWLPGRLAGCIRLIKVVHHAISARGNKQLTRYLSWSTDCTVKAQTWQGSTTTWLGAQFHKKSRVSY